MWTRFYDMHSGGGKNMQQDRIYIEAEELEAKRVFFARFDEDPNGMNCSCCGPNYSIVESETLEDAAEYDRDGLTLSEFIARDDVAVIYSTDITPEERVCLLPVTRQVTTYD